MDRFKDHEKLFESENKKFINKDNLNTLNNSYFDNNKNEYVYGEKARDNIFNKLFK